MPRNGLLLWRLADHEKAPGLKRTDRDNQRIGIVSRPFRVRIEGGQTEEERRAEKEQEHQIARRTARWTKVTSIGTAAASIFGAVAAGIFAFQLRATQDQLIEQRTEFRLDQRPILAFVPIPEGNGMPATGPSYQNMTYGWNYGVRNTGKGTALQIKMFEYVSILGSHFTAIVDGKGRYNSDLGPGEFFWNTAFFNAPLTEDRFNLAKSTEGGNIVKIILKYKDVFGKIYEGYFCTYNYLNGSNANCLPSQFSIPTDGEQYEKEYK
jgi:hypothetical protein